MGVPPHGSKKYEEYLKKQMLRRRRERAITKKKKAVRTLGPDLKKLQKTMREAIQNQEKTTMKSNAHWRKLCRAETRCETLQAEIEELKRFLRLSRKETKTAQEETIYYKRFVVKWSDWWERLKMQASSKSLGWIYKLGRPPPASTDRCWGGGQ